MIHVTRRATMLALAALPLLDLRAGAKDGAAGVLFTPLLDASLSKADLPARYVAAMEGAQRLDAELVSQWRSSLRASLQSRGGRVVALARWDKALILSGLAREERLRVTSTRLSQGVFQVEFEV
jgi:hypothetical protein